MVSSAWIEISVSSEARDMLVFFGWASRISENFNGKGPNFKGNACLGLLTLCCNFAHCSSVSG